MPITLNGDTGIVSPAIDVTTPITVSDGGTGLSSPGTTGNVLTSNGTAWTSAALPAGGVTSLNGETGAITNTNYDAIGSYVVAAENTYTASLERLPNVTVAGSTLFRSTETGSAVGGASMNGNPSNVTVASASSTSLSLSGTWRRMTRSRNPTNGTSSATNLYVRIS